MKHLTAKLSAAVAGVLFTLFGTAQADAITVPIYAGQNILVGEAISYTDDSSLYLYVWIDPRWKVGEIHFQPVSSVSEFPTGEKGNPKIGNFQYSSSDFSTVDLFGYDYLYIRIPRSSFPNPTSPTVCAAFHAVVSPAPGSGFSGKSETAWAAGTQFVSGANWGSYFCITGSNHED